MSCSSLPFCLLLQAEKIREGYHGLNIHPVNPTDFKEQKIPISIISTENL